MTAIATPVAPRRPKAQERPSRRPTHLPAGNPLAMERIDWRTIASGCTLVRVHATRWYAEQKLTPEDLGLENAPEEFLTYIRTHLDLGSQILMPKEAINALKAEIAAARKAQVDCGFKGPGEGYLVANRAFDICLDRLEEVQAKFYAIRDEVVENYPVWRAEFLVNVREFARTRLALSRGRDVSKAAEEFSDAALAGTPEGEVLERYVAKIADAILTPEQIKARFTLNWAVMDADHMTGRLADHVGSQLAEAEARVREAEAQAKFLEAELQGNGKGMRKAARSQVETARLKAELDRVLAEAEQERERLRTQRRIDKEKARTEQTVWADQVETVMSTVAAQLCSILWQATESVKQALVGADKVNLRTIGTLKKAVDKVTMLNVGGNVTIERAAALMTDLAEKATDPKNLKDVRRSVVDLGDAMAGMLAQLRSDSRTDLPVEMPKSVDMERAARAATRLKLTDAVVEVADDELRSGNARAL